MTSFVFHATSDSPIGEGEAYIAHLRVHDRLLWRMACARADAIRHEGRVIIHASILLHLAAHVSPVDIGFDESDKALIPELSPPDFATFHSPGVPCAETTLVVCAERFWVECVLKHGGSVVSPAYDFGDIAPAGLPNPGESVRLPEKSLDLLRLLLRAPLADAITDPGTPSPGTALAATLGLWGLIGPDRCPECGAEEGERGRTAAEIERLLDGHVAFVCGGCGYTIVYTNIT